MSISELLKSTEYIRLSIPRVLSNTEYFDSRISGTLQILTTLGNQYPEYPDYSVHVLSTPGTTQGISWGGLRRHPGVPRSFGRRYSGYSKWPMLVLHNPDTTPSNSGGAYTTPLRYSGPSEVDNLHPLELSVFFAVHVSEVLSVSGSRPFKTLSTRYSFCPENPGHPRASMSH